MVRQTRKCSILLGFAAVTALGSAARATWVFNGLDGNDWFDGNNWYNTIDDVLGPPTTGALPDTTQTTNINTGVAGSVALFDPAVQINNAAEVATVARLY